MRSGSGPMSERLAARLPDVRFATLIDRSASVGRGATIGPGTVVMPQSVLGPACAIGTGCILNTSSTLDHDHRFGYRDRRRERLLLKVGNDGLILPVIVTSGFT